MEISLIPKECVICLDDVNRPHQSFIHCSNCRNFYHDDCYFTWKNKKNSKKCPYCQLETLTYYQLFSPSCCCFPIKKESYHVPQNI